MRRRKPELERASMEKPDNGERLSLESCCESSSPIAFRDLHIIGAGFCRGLLGRDARCRSVRLGPRIVKCCNRKQG
jgi:hypothetical protein